jgi:glycosyltransferase involved in cell wall biosynthesis
MNKKTVLIHSNFCKAFTGFGKHKKNILRYLFKTGKYNIIELANGRHWNDPALERLPWKCVGSLPEANVMARISDPNEQRAAAYGSYMIDKAIEEFKPDLYIGIEDIWAFNNFFEKPWWSKINSMIWTTLDSLPILQTAIDAAPKVDHYYVWASFAEKAMKKIGYDHVKTLRGSLNVNDFYRMPDEERSNLRRSFGLKDEFIVGFVFRNQLRKSVPNILEGFKEFKKEVPNAKLLLHTHWSEGWNIPDLLKEKSIDSSDILTTYFCSSCKKYEIKSFTSEQLNCPYCNGQKTVNTTNINNGVNEIQLNEIYNLMDVYCHPFTSGGQEIPIQEAKLTELITLVTDYSCGEDYCTEESGGFPLQWNEYREPGTQFIKASTCAIDIARKLKMVYEMPSIERVALGIQARKFVIEHCSIEAIGKQLEEIIDSLPEIDKSNLLENDLVNPNFEPKPSSDVDSFIIDCYMGFLNEKIDKNSSVFKHWRAAFEKENIEKQFISNLKNKASSKTFKPVNFEDVLDKDDAGKRIAVVIPTSETDIFLVNGLMKNLKKQYPKHNIYVITKPEYFGYIEDSPYIHKCIPYSEQIDNPAILEGVSDHAGYFDLAFFPNVTTQKIITYVHNGKDKIQFSLQ